MGRLVKIFRLTGVWGGQGWAPGVGNGLLLLAKVCSRYIASSPTAKYYFALFGLFLAERNTAFPLGPCHDLSLKPLYLPYSLWHLLEPKRMVFHEDRYSHTSQDARKNGCVCSCFWRPWCETVQSEVKRGPGATGDLLSHCPAA